MTKEDFELEFAVARGHLEKAKTQLRKLQEAYVEEHAPFKLGDTVYYKRWSDDHEPEEVGLVSEVACDKHMEFLYLIQPLTKALKEHKGKNMFWLKKWGSRPIEIRKYED